MQEIKRGRIHAPHKEHLHPLYKLPPDFRTSQRAEALADTMARGVKTNRSSKLKRARFGGTPAPTTVAKAVAKATRAQAYKTAGFADFSFVTTEANTTGYIAHLGVISQGSSTNQRIGKRITYKSVQVRGHVVVGSATKTADTTMCIVYDRDPGAAVPTIAEIFNSASPNSFLNDNNSDRFRILRRLDMNLCGNSTTPATGREIFQLEEFIDLKGLKAEYKTSSTGGVMGDLTMGALYVVLLSDMPGGTTAPVYGFGARIRFADTQG